MIEGLHFDLSGQELSRHYQQRIDHHNERVDFYTQQADNLTAGDAQPQQYTNGDPVRALRESAKQHKAKVRTFVILRDHTDVGETYRLAEDELHKIEMIERLY